MGQSRPLFVYFRPFRVTIPIQIEKRVDGVLGIQTRDRKMVGADETTELWWPPKCKKICYHSLSKIAQSGHTDCQQQFRYFSVETEPMTFQ